MGKSLTIRKAKRLRDELYATNEKEIKRMYINASKQIAKDLRNSTSSLQSWVLQSVSDQINNQINDIVRNVDSMARTAIEQTARFVVDDVMSWTRTFGINFKNAYMYVPTDVVESIASGAIYEGDWNLSSAVWGYGEKIKSDLMSVISEGFAQNKSVYDISKDVERYMNPNDIKSWDWSKVYPHTSKVVDYNAQRLVRTIMQHAFQQSFINTTYYNPFVTKYRWLASGTHRMCEICAERDGQTYEKDDLPIDHPNGMCTYEAIIPDSNEDITDRLANWVNGDSDLELDTWFSTM